MLPNSCLQLVHAYLSSILITSYVKAWTLLVDLEHLFKIGLSAIGWTITQLLLVEVFFFTRLLLHYILLHIPVHNQLKPNAFKDMKNNKAYNVFDSEVRPALTLTASC